MLTTLLLLDNTRYVPSNRYDVPCTTRLTCLLTGVPTTPLYAVHEYLPSSFLLTFRITNVPLRSWLILGSLLRGINELPVALLHSTRAGGYPNVLHVICAVRSLSTC